MKLKDRTAIITGAKGIGRAWAGRPLAEGTSGQTIYADDGRLPLNYTVPVKS